VKIEKITYYLVVLFLCFFSFGYSQSISYKKDSLQIKVYTEIDYVNKRVKEIVVKKVFCDYCSENQIKFLKEKALELATYDKYNPKKRLINGTRKFALIIRVSKKDFLEIKTNEDSIINQF